MPGERGVTVVIPAYNEEGGIAATIDGVLQALKGSGWKFEIIVVDDGSTDTTARMAADQGVGVVQLSANQGYGAALKAGIARAKYEWVALIDADGTYPAAALPKLLERTESNDMVVGARIGSHVQDPLIRRPAKWLLRKFAGILAGQKIPDLNSGLRVIRKSAVGEFAVILPSGFSFTTTITLAMIACGYLVAYVPIDYFKRVGKSKLKPFHVFKFVFLILRTMLLLRPVRLLAPVAAIVILAGLGKLIFDLQFAYVSASAGIVLLQGVLIWWIAVAAGRSVRFRQSKR